MNAAGVARRAAIAYALLVVFTLTGMMQRDAFLQTGTLSEVSPCLQWMGMPGAGDVSSTFAHA